MGLNQAMTKKQATIKDVAAQAGVSYQTVSRVINNHTHVSAKTRLKVQQTIEAMNFKPNLAARSLPQRRSFIIGLIIPYEAEYLIRDPNLLAQISGIEAEANLRNYNLLLSTAGHSKSGLSAYERFIRNRVADGALVFETASSQVGNELLAKQAYPYVSIGRDLSNLNAYSVHNDSRNGSYQATRYLIEKGHRRIGLINGPATGAVGSLGELLTGHRQALAEANLPFDSCLLTQGDYTFQSGETAAQRLLSLADRPSAIFALNDSMAMGAIRALHRAGLRVPEDMAVIGYDDIPAAADFNPPLTTVRQCSKTLGQVAVLMLFKLLEGEPVSPKEVILPVELIIRQST
jgi:DNA-binding LacI/PurR family transcriptional regulator